MTASVVTAKHSGGSPPTISTIPNQSMAANSTLQVGFVVADPDTSAKNLQVSAISSNPPLVGWRGLSVTSGSKKGKGNQGQWSLLVTPNQGQTGSTTITVAATDGTSVARQTFTVTVMSSNSPPTLSSIPDATIDEDTTTGAIPFTVADLDTNLSALQVSGASSNPALVPQSGIAFAGGGTRTVEVTPAPNQSGSATITVTVSDQAGGLATDAFAVTVLPVNDPPAISQLPDIAIDEDTTAGPFVFAVGDLETSPSALTITAGSSNATLLPASAIQLAGAGPSRTIQLTPLPNASGTTTVTVVVSDADGATASDSFVLTVSAKPDPPTIGNIPDQVMAEDTSTGPVPITVADTDDPADALQISAVSSDQSVVPNSALRLGGAGSTRTIEATSAPDQWGATIVTVIVTDPAGGSATDTFLLRVTAVPDAPTISTISNQQTPQNSATPPIAFTIGDADNPSASPAAGLMLAGGSSNQTLVPQANIAFSGAGAARSLVVTPATGQSGSTVIAITVSDGTLSATTSFTLQVNSVNAPPVLSTLADQLTPEDTPLTLLLTVSDPDSAAAALSVSATSSNAALVPPGGLVLGGMGTTRTLTVTPAPNATGTSTLTVTVTDGLASAAASFLLTVTPVNDPPAIASIGGRTINEDGTTGPIAIVLGDPDNPPGNPAAGLVLSATASDQGLVPTGSVVFGGTQAAPTVSITPAANQNGSATVTITVTDAARAQASSSLVLQVLPVDDPPSISPIADQQTAEDTPTAAIPFGVADPDTPANPSSGLTLTGSSSNQTLVPNGAIVFGGSGISRTVTVTPELGRSGVTVVTITVVDPTGRSASEQFALSVANVPCTFSVVPATLSVPSAGGMLVAQVSTGGRSSCGWTADSTAPWITVTSPPRGVVAFGNGGVQLTIGPNTSPARRTGTLDIAGSHVPVSQAGQACTYSLSAAPDGFTDSGGSGTIVVGTNAGCAWTVAADVPWIRPGATTAAGAGPGTIPFSVDANSSGAPRAGAISTSGQSVPIGQAGPATTADGDGDGLPDAWERQFGLDASSFAFADSAAGDPDRDAASNLEEYRRGTHPRGVVTRFLAEGATGPFFRTLLALANPQPAPALVLSIFQRDDGAQFSYYLVVPPHSRRSIDVAANVPELAAAAFSTRVESDGPLVVDRTMSWGAGSYGAHSESSVASPLTTWYLAEGATHSGFNLFYLIQNPNPVAADVAITYLRPAPAPPVSRVYTVAANSRYSVWVGTSPDDPPLQNTDVSAVVTAPVPIVVERAMYLSRGNQFFAAGHAGAGIPAPRTDWYLAEGATSGMFQTFILLANPSSSDATVEVRFLLESGAPITYVDPAGGGAVFTLPANSRKTIWANLVPGLTNAGFSTAVRVVNGVGILAERAMWWPGSPATWYEAHDSAGVADVGTRWGLADGEAGGPLGVDTFVLIANPSPASARVVTTLLFEDGTTASRTDTVGGDQRRTIWVNVDAFADSAGQPVPVGGRRFGILVDSVADPIAATAAPVPVVVERAMYWSTAGQFWAAGTNAVATRLQ